MEYLAWLDYLILVAFIVISVGIGVYHSLTGGRQKTTSEFIMADRSLKVIPTALSLFVSFKSAVLILGIPAEMYSYGPQFMIMAMLGFTVGVTLTVQVAIPWMYPMKLVSVNEYFERRFNSRSVRVFASIISVLSAIMHISASIYAPSAALQSATGLPIVVSIPVMGVAAIVYTALGGMRAVIWTDVFQCFIMMGGLIAILIKGLVAVGGFGNVFRLCSQSGRWSWVDWSPDPTVRHTVWGFLFGHSMQWFGIYGLSQPAVQRYSAIKTQSQARLTAALNVPTCCIFISLVGVTGLTVVAYYASIGCDPMANHDISNTNQLLTHFVFQIFSDVPGFAGIFLATLYGAALSSVSSSLSGAAANCWEDILQWKLMDWPESRKALLNRFLVLLFGLVATGLAFVAFAVPGPINQICTSLVGATLGPLFGMFLLGGLNRYANWKGALIGGITSLIGSSWLTIGSLMLKRRHPTLPPLSIDGCLAPNNVTFSTFDDNNSSSTFHFVDKLLINDTMTYLLPQTNTTIGTPLHGLEKFYSISYLWYSLLWTLVTIFVGTVASFLFKDGSLEERVDEDLLINFSQCFQCRGDSRFNFRAEKCTVVSCANVDIGAEEADKLQEPFQPFLHPTTKRSLSPAIQLKQTENWRVKTQQDVKM